MAEEPENSKSPINLEREKKYSFEKHTVKLLQKLGKIPDSAKEVFLWDLIRLANSALYRYRLKCLDKKRIERTDNSEFFIQIEADTENNTLSITHKGLGYSKDDLMDGIGRISEDMVNDYVYTIDKYLMNGDPNDYYSAVPGVNFSPGFYSAFMVADRVVITTKEVVPSIDRVRAYLKGNYAKQKRGQYVWDFVWDASEGDGFFRIAPDPKPENQLKRGTKVTLYLKNEYRTYLDESTLRELVDKYTFAVCPYPIYVSADLEREKKRQRTAGNSSDELESLKKEFGGLQELCLQALRLRVKKVVVDDRVFDLPSYLSDDGQTFVINPRSPIFKSLLADFNENPDRQREEVMNTFMLQYQIFSALPRVATHMYNSRPSNADSADADADADASDADASDASDADSADYDSADSDSDSDAVERK